MKKLYLLVIFLFLITGIPTHSQTLRPARDVLDLINKTEDTTPGGDSILYCVDDPAGTPAQRKCTLANLLKAGITVQAGVPTSDDDSGDGYYVGYKWIVSDGSEIYEAVDVTAATAVWRKTYPAVETQTLDTVADLDPKTTGRNSFANALRIEGTTANSGAAIYQSDTTGLNFNCYVAGTENDCDYYRQLNAGKKFGIKDSAGNVLADATENTDGYYQTARERTANAPQPATGYWSHFYKSDGLYIVDDANNVTGPLGAGGGSTVKNLCRWDAKQGHAPATLFAQLDSMAGTSTPAEVIPILKFDPSTIWYMDFRCQIPAHYAGGGYTLSIYHSNTTATLEVVFSGAFRRVVLDGEDLDTTAHTYDYNDSAAVTVASAIGEVVKTTITFTDGADADSATASDYIVLRIRRFVTDAGDDNTGVAQVHLVVLDEQ